MAIVTVYALIGDDIRLISTTIEADNTFTALTSISLFLFVVELVLASVGKDDYFNSFFFWLDLVSTISLITDIKPVWDVIMGIESYDASDDTTSSSVSADSEAGQIARASRGARIGTRAGRMARIIRLIRLIRIVKLYKASF